MLICRLSYLSAACHGEGKEDQLDEMRSEIQHQKLVSGYASGQVNKSAGWPASSTKALHNPQALQLLHSCQPLPKALRAIINS